MAHVKSRVLDSDMAEALNYCQTQGTAGKERGKGESPLPAKLQSGK